MSEKFNIDTYPFTIRILTADEGGGYLIEYPDLPGCMSDGDSPEQAVANGRDAVLSYLRSCKQHGDPIPAPGCAASSSGQFRLRVPKTMHARLTARAKREGVSLNTLVTSLIAEALGRDAQHKPAQRKPAHRKPAA
jgi:antitoxin HicB